MKILFLLGAMIVAALAMQPKQDAWKNHEDAGQCFVGCMAEKDNETLCVGACLLIHCAPHDERAINRAELEYNTTRYTCTSAPYFIPCLGRLLNRVVDQACSDC